LHPLSSHPPFLLRQPFLSKPLLTSFFFAVIVPLQTPSHPPLLLRHLFLSKFLLTLLFLCGTCSSSNPFSPSFFFVAPVPLQTSSHLLTSSLDFVRRHCYCCCIKFSWPGGKGRKGPRHGCGCLKCIWGRQGAWTRAWAWAGWVWHHYSFFTPL